jgi:hypothetical protein
LWRHYHTGTKALIFVVDSQDRDRLHEARVELHRILTARELQDAILLVFANKQDLKQSMTTREVEERLGLDKFPERVWMVMGSCATSGDGLMEGLNWLAENIRAPRTRSAGPDVSDSEGSTNAAGPGGSANAGGSEGLTNAGGSEGVTNAVVPPSASS